MSLRPVNPSEIIRCLKYDGYTATEGARYCRRIAVKARFNDACPGDSEAYEEAARRLEAEAERQKVYEAEDKRWS
jgi:hypothetical protein